MTKSLLDIAKEQGAKIKRKHENWYSEHDYIVFKNEAQLQAIIDAVNAQVSEPVDNGQPYGIVDPDYARVFTKARCIAWMYGYAVLMQGSFTRDLDLLIVPWTDKASTEPQHIINMICSKCNLEENGHPPTNKPHGRISYTLMFKEFGDPRFIDISFMPVSPQTLPPEKLWLWNNGDHFLAYRHEYPCYETGGDPLTVGEPIGYAILYPSYDRN